MKRRNTLDSEGLAHMGLETGLWALKLGLMQAVFAAVWAICWSAWALSDWLGELRCMAALRLTRYRNLCPRHCGL